MATPLITAAEASAAWAGFAALPAAEQAALLAASSGVVERACDRVIGRRILGEAHRPGRSRRIRLGQYPVAAVDRVAADPTVVLWVRHVDPAAPRATVAYATSGPPGAESFTGLTLWSAGAPATTLDLADHATLLSLAGAIAVVPGWSAQIAPGFEGWAVADLAYSVGAQGAKAAAVELVAFASDLIYRLDDPETGELSLSESCGPVWVSYAAGFETADVPADLKRAALIALKALRDRCKTTGLYSGESLGDYSYTLADLPDGVAGLVEDLVSRHRRVGCA